MSFRRLGYLTNNMMITSKGDIWDKWIEVELSNDIPKNIEVIRINSIEFRVNRYKPADCNELNIRYVMINLNTTLKYLYSDRNPQNNVVEVLVSNQLRSVKFKGKTYEF